MSKEPTVCWDCRHRSDSHHPTCHHPKAARIPAISPLLGADGYQDKDGNFTFDSSPPCSEINRGWCVLFEAKDPEADHE